MPSTLGTKLPEPTSEGLDDGELAASTGVQSSG